MKRILDKNVSDRNYARFAQCKILKEGKAVLFQYPSGGSYEVDLAVLLSWFDQPHYFLRNGRLEDWKRGKTRINDLKLSIQSIRRVLSRHALRVYMNDGSVYDVAWDTVLMGCEPKYEWFGGLKEIGEIGVGLKAPIKIGGE